jgi:hypothetical protein
LDLRIQGFKMKKISVLSLFTAMAVAVPTAQAGDLNINGFLSVGASVLDNDDITLDDFDGNGNFKSDTILGLQISKQVNDKTTVTGQLVSRGSEDYSTEAAWAYAGYAATDDLDIRLGRIRVPFFYYSDFLEVGYAYDWVRPPSEVYSSPFSSIDGTDLNYRFALGNWDNNVQVYYGRFNEEGSGVDLKNFTGLALTSSTGDFTLRGSYHRLEIESDGTGSFGSLNAAAAAAIGTTGADLNSGLLLLGFTNQEIAAAQADFSLTGQELGFYGLAAGYDNGDISAVAEFTKSFSDSTFFPDTTASLIKVGKRFNQFVGHLTYSATENELASGIDGTIQEAIGLEDKQSSIIAGLRYDYDTNTALKFEVQNHDEEIVSGAKGESGMLYTVAIDLVF